MKIEEIKDLITFCRAQKIRSAKIEGLEFEFSELAHVTEDTEALSHPMTKDPDIGGLLEDEEDPEDVLFHSVRG